MKKPIGGSMDNKKIISIFLLIAFMIFPVYVNAAKNVPEKSGYSKVTQMCFACHSDKTLNKKLMNKEILSLYIDSNQFAGSVHGKVGCSGCHPNITLDNHPKVQKIRSKSEYSAECVPRPAPCVILPNNSVRDNRFTVLYPQKAHVLSATDHTI